jgi:hypothetical protein
MTLDSTVCLFRFLYSPLSSYINVVSSTRSLPLLTFQ